MQRKKYYTYIVASRSGTVCIGITSNLYVRVRQHKDGDFEGFSSKYHCDRLVYWESFDEAIQAINREKQFKGWRRSKKIGLIESVNPRWQDLAEHWGAEMSFAGQSITNRQVWRFAHTVILSGVGVREANDNGVEGPLWRRNMLGRVREFSR